MTASEETSNGKLSSDNSQTGENFDLDTIYTIIGEYGKYQKLLIWLICIPVCVVCGIQSFKQVLISETPNHWCRPPPEFEMAANISEITKKHFSIPMEIGNSKQLTYSMCQMYDVNYTQLVHLITNKEIRKPEFSTWPKIPCKYGWIYDKTYFVENVVIKWDLVCNKDILPTVAQSVLHVGGMIGVILFGHIADRWGRRISVLLCITISVISETVSGLAPEYISWTLFRFFAGLCVQALYQIPFILCIEIVGPSKRTLVSVLSYIFFSVGLILLSIIAYFIRNGRVLTLVTSAPFAIFLICWRYLPETPRWLLSQGRVDEAIKVLESVASVNKKPFPDYLHTSLKTQALSKDANENPASKSRNNLSLTALFKTRTIRKISIIATFCWFTNMTVYGGLSIYSSKIYPNPYLGFALGAAVELPSHVIMIWVMEVWTRRWSICVLMTLGGISCILTTCMPQDNSTAILILYLVGKFAVAATYLIIYAYATELYPTEMRGIGLGFASYTGMLGGSIIPFVDYLGVQSLSMPLVIQGVLIMAGGIAILALPETLHQGLPQTIQEAEKLGQTKMTKDTFFTCCIPKKSLKQRP